VGDQEVPLHLVFFQEKEPPVWMTEDLTGAYPSLVKAVGNIKKYRLGQGYENKLLTVMAFQQTKVSTRRQETTTGLDDDVVGPGRVNLSLLNQASDELRGICRIQMNPSLDKQFEQVLRNKIVKQIIHEGSLVQHQQVKVSLGKPCCDQLMKQVCYGRRIAAKEDTRQ